MEGEEKQITRLWFRICWSCRTWCLTRNILIPACGGGGVCVSVCMCMEWVGAPMHQHPDSWHVNLMSLYWAAEQQHPVHPQIYIQLGKGLIISWFYYIFDSVHTEGKNIAYELTLQYRSSSWCHVCWRVCQLSSIICTWIYDPSELAEN